MLVSRFWRAKFLFHVEYMYYSYVEIEYVATSFSPARTDLALKLLSLDCPSDGPPPLNVTFPAVLVPFLHPPLHHIALLVARRGGCHEGTNTAGKATLNGRLGWECH